MTGSFQTMVIQGRRSRRPRPRPVWVGRAPRGRVTCRRPCPYRRIVRLASITGHAGERTPIRSHRTADRPLRADHARRRRCATAPPSRRCTFEVFARRLPDGRRYGVVAGTGRLLEAHRRLPVRRRRPSTCCSPSRRGRRRDAPSTCATTASAATSTATREGELYFPYSPMLTVTGTFAERGRAGDAGAVDPQPRLRRRLGRGPDGHRRRRAADHRDGLAAHPRAGGRGRGPGRLPRRVRLDVQPGRGRALRRPDRRHRRARVHPAARRRAGGLRARRSPRSAPAPRCSSTPTTSPAASRRRSTVAGPALGAIRIDSGDLGVLARHARAQLDALGATGTRIVVSGDLDEYAIAALAAAPVDVYGAGTAVVTGSGRPDRRAGLQAGRGRRPAGGQAVGAQGAATAGARARCRRHKPTGTAIEEIVVARPASRPTSRSRPCSVPLVRAGTAVAACRALARGARPPAGGPVTLPWDGLKLSRGEPAIPTRDQSRPH